VRRHPGRPPVPARSSIRHPARHLAIASGVVLCVTAAGFPGLSGRESPGRVLGAPVPVTSCPVPQGMGAPAGSQGPAAPPVPASTVFPQSISLPPETTVFGTGLPGSPVVAYSLAPSGFTCSAIAGADGSFVISLDAPGSRNPSLTYDFSPGGAGLALDLACPYIPAIRAADAVFRGGQQNCAYPGADVVTQVPTDVRDLWAATVRIPPDVADPNLPASGTGRDQTLAVFLASLQSHPDPAIVQSGGQEADCALPASEQAVCVAGLQYFVTQSMAASGGPKSVAAVLAAVSDASAASELPCPAALSLGLEQEIDKSAELRIPVPRATINLPYQLAGQASVSFVPGEVNVCQSSLTTALNTPDGFDNGDMSLRATTGDGGTRGPFVYSADAAAWVQVPGAPPGQRLTTKFDPSSVSASVAPQMVIGFSTAGGEPEAEVQIAQVTIAADHQEVTLVAPPGPTLQIGLGPTLELDVSVKKAAADQAIEDEESQGIDPSSAETDVADQLGGDAVAAIEQSSADFYGLDISSSVSQQLFSELQIDLVSAFQADPLVAAFDPAAADAVASDVTAADAAAIDAETAAEASIDVDAIEVLAVLFL
jgi:hypothetical protein